MENRRIVFQCFETFKLVSAILGIIFGTDVSELRRLWASSQKSVRKGVCRNHLLSRKSAAPHDREVHPDLRLPFVSSFATVYQTCRGNVRKRPQSGIVKWENLYLHRPQKSPKHIPCTPTTSWLKTKAFRCGENKSSSPGVESLRWADHDHWRVDRHCDSI